MSKRFLFLALTMLAAPAAAQVQTSVCEVLKSRGDFDGKTVRLRATVIRGFEVFAVEDPKDGNCGRIWLVYRGGGPVASTSFGGRTPDIRRPSIKPREDGELKRFQSLLDARVYPREQGADCMDCWRYQVTATMTGRIDSAHWWQGFGHLNAYPAQLVLQSVSEVTPEDQISRYDAKRFSPTPVKFPAGSLSGRVLDSGGRPVTDLEVTVISTESSDFWGGFQRQTDKNGGFSFELPPGSYRLGVNLESPSTPEAPFPATYYPGSATEKGAKIVAVADGQHVKDLVIHLAPALRPRRVPVRVVWPGDEPAEKANVWLTEVARPYAVVGGPVSHTGRDGSFNLRGLEGIDYAVHANIHVKPFATPYCAETRTLKASDRITGPLVMVLTRTGGVCDSGD